MKEKETRPNNLENIKPYPRNSKKHPDKQLKQIAISLREYGWRQPIVVDKNNEIIVGHGRWMAYKKYPEGIKEPWVVKADDLTPEKVKGYRLMDNKSNESDWDMELVLEELKELDNLGFNIDLTGFDKDLLIVPDEKDDEIPDNVETRVKLGDIWQLGPHRLMCGDSTQQEAVLALMGGVKADMVFTDPPYNVDYEGYTEKKLKIKNDKKSTESFVTDLNAWFKSYAEVIKSGAGMYICYPSRFHREFQNSLEENGFEIRNQIIWAKNTFAWGMGRYKYQHEPILYCYVKGKTDSWYGDKTQNTLWNVNKPSKSEEHPTMKPVELITKAIVNSSKEEDIILDLFLGSGSTLIAAEKTGRICYGMEIDEKYCDVIIQRYENFSGLKSYKI